LIKQTTPDVVNEYQDDEKSTPPPSEMNVSNGAPQAGSGLDDPSETSAIHDESVAVASTAPLTQDGPLQRLYDEIDYRMKNIIFLPDFRKYTEDLSDLQFVLRLTEESEDATRLRYLADRSEMETAQITAPVNSSVVVEAPIKEHTEEMKVEQLPPTKPVYKITKPLTTLTNTRKTERLPFLPLQTDTSATKTQIAPAAAAAGGNRIKKTRKRGKMTPKKQKKWRAIRQTKQRLERTYHRRSRHHVKK
jgi:hypothetical protein